MNLDKMDKKLEKELKKRVRKFEKQIKKEYQSLLENLNNQISKIYTKYEKNGKLTYAEMNKYDRLNALKSELLNIITQHSKTAYKVFSEGIQLEYLESYKYTAYSIEMLTKANVNFSQLTQKQIEASLDNPVNGLTLSDTLNKNRQNIIYNINREVTKGIYNGSTYGTIAKAIKSVVGDDYKKAIRIARTETHRVNELGKNESAKSYMEQGIIMTKTWKTSQDERVRSSHVVMEGQTVKANEDFVYPYDKSIRGPAPGSMGSASFDINCRCRISRDIVDIQAPKKTGFKEVSYEKWSEDNK